jgi:hypothetical protein
MHHRAGLVLGDGRRTAGFHGMQLVGAVPAHAGQQRAHHPRPVHLGERAEQERHGRPQVAFALSAAEGNGTPCGQPHVAIVRCEVNMPGRRVHAVGRHFHHQRGAFGEPRDQARQEARRQVLHHEDGRREARRQVRQDSL